MEFGRRGGVFTKNRRKLGLLLVLLAACLYAPTLSRYADPGQPARLVVLYSGLDPFPPLTHPLWHGVVRLVAAMPFASLPFRLNLASMVCGLGAIWLFYLLMCRQRQAVFADAASERVRMATAVGAALYLMVSVPFQYASTRAYPATFDLLFLLGALYLLIRYREEGRRAWLYGFGLFYGIGIPEFTTLVVVAPVLGLYALWLMRRHADLTPRPAGALLLCGLSGFLVYGVYAVAYTQTDAYTWRAFRGLYQVLWFMWRDQWVLISRTLTAVGWLLVVLVSVLPWVLSNGIVKENVRRRRSWRTLLLPAVISGITLVVLFNGRIAPWSFVGLEPLLVTPYLFIAASFGLMMSFWYQRLALCRERHPAWGRAAFGVVMVAGVVACGLSGLSRRGGIDNRSSAVAAAWADEVLDALGRRDWLITNGLLDNHLQLAAHERGKRLRLVNVNLLGDDAYDRYVQSGFRNPSLKSLAAVALTAAIKEWLFAEREAHERMAVVHTPRVWLATGLTAVPDRVLYLAEAEAAAVDVERLLAAHEAFYAAFIPSATKLAESGHRHAVMGRTLLRHAARIANDLGVLLEDLGWPQEASRAYERARASDPDNISALLNLWVLHGDEAERAETLASAIERRLRGLSALPSLEQLAGRYGRVRSPVAAGPFLDLWTAARPAPETAAGVNQAMFFIRHRDFDRARHALEEIVEADPEAEGPWVLLSAIADAQWDMELYRRCVEEMQRRETEWAPVLLIQAKQALAERDHERAGELLRRAHRLAPSNTGLLELILRLNIRLGRREEVAAAMERLLTLDPRNGWANFALGNLQYERNEPALAEAAFRRSLRREPLPEALNNLAWLLYEQGELDEALKWARQATESGGSHYAAWDTLGVIWMAREHYGEAEKALRRARRIAPDAIPPRIHLADLLLRTGRGAEAAALIDALDSARLPVTPEQEEKLSALREAVQGAGAAPLGARREKSK